MLTTPRAVLHIDLSNLEHNYERIKAKLSAGVRTLCVVKADAYGHGAPRIAKRLESAGGDYLGVATVTEGIELRDHGIGAPILVMSGIFLWEDLSLLLQKKLSLVIHDFDTLKRIADASGLSRPLKVHLKFDTGMGRLGFSPADIPALLDALKGAENIRIEGVMSHLASSEIRDEYGLTQIHTFNEILQVLHRSGIRPEFTHMANTGGIINYPEAHFDMVRVGIGLYGSYPGMELSEKLPLKQVMKFVSRIALIKEFPPGYSLSYGRTFTTQRKTKVAYVPVGYADGYPRSLSNKGSVLIKDKRWGIIGRVCMDWFLVDITGLQDVDVQEEVILLGQSDTDVITADEIARFSGTIPYEIMCNISKRVERVYA